MSIPRSPPKSPDECPEINDALFKQIHGVKYFNGTESDSPDIIGFCNVMAAHDIFIEYLKEHTEDEYYIILQGQSKETYDWITTIPIKYPDSTLYGHVGYINSTDLLNLLRRQDLPKLGCSILFRSKSKRSFCYITIYVASKDEFANYSLI